MPDGVYCHLTGLAQYKPDLYNNNIICIEHFRSGWKVAIIRRSYARLTAGSWRLTLGVRTLIVLKLLKNSAIKMIGLLFLGVTLSAYAVSDKQRADIEERIKPVGSVCLQGDNSCGAVAAVADSASAKPAEDIYNSNCMACHNTGAAGAPKLGDTADWSARLEKGIDQVYAHAIDGFKGMPARGLCMSCSYYDLIAIFVYIVENCQ